MQKLSEGKLTDIHIFCSNLSGQRVHGPSQHRNKWRLVVRGADRSQEFVSFATEAAAWAQDEAAQGNRWANGERRGARARGQHARAWVAHVDGIARRGSSARVLSARR